MSEVDLSGKFPEVQPLASVPTLFTFNGIGSTLYGRRQTDPETGLYIKTLCICVLFLPIFCLKSYVVADAEKGWYFLGRVPLSGLAKAWNWAVILLCSGSLLTLGIVNHLGSPEVVGRETLRTAAEHWEAGRVAAAAALWSELINGQTSHAVTAEQELARGLATALDASQERNAVLLVGNVTTLTKSDAKERLTADLYPRGSALVDRVALHQPAEGLALLDILRPLWPADQDQKARREKLLEAAVGGRPDDPKLASELALIFEARGEKGRLLGLLAPHIDRLGTLEGARILGLLEAEGGRLESSRALLLPYTQGRLAQLSAAKAHYDRVANAAWQREIEQLDKNAAPQDWYRDYEKADEKEQARMVEEWVGPRIRADQQIAEAEAKLVESTGIVPVALDLGILMIQRAAGLDDGQRKKELETAEQILIGIEGFADESDYYRISLGKVRYWLGKATEGKKIFSEFLASKNRDPGSLVAIGHALREVGAISEATEITKEAYHAAEVGPLKDSAAGLMANLVNSTDERILWLERISQGGPHARASLASARGDRAFSKGQKLEARKHYGEALQIYAKAPESSTSLNNAALVEFALFNLTGAKSSFQAGAAKMERAVTLEPGNSILLSNTASTLVGSAVLDIVGDEIDFSLLQSGASTDFLGNLYADAAGRELVRARFANHPATAKARDLYNKVLVLAPQESSAYRGLLPLIKGKSDELQTLKALRSRLNETQLDMASELEMSRRYFAGEQDEDLQSSHSVRLKELQAIVERVGDRRDLTAVIAQDMLAEAHLQALVLGLEVDLETALSLSVQADQNRHSSATASTLRAILLARALASVAKKAPEAAKWNQPQARRTVGVLAVPLLMEKAEMAAAFLKDPDFQRAIALSSADLEAYPDDIAAFDWALLRHAEPARAQKTVALISEVSLLRDEIELLTSAVPLNAACNRLWHSQMKGAKPDLEPLQRLAKLGFEVPLPGS
jgi:hypothetical protein